MKDRTKQILERLNRYKVVAEQMTASEVDGTAFWRGYRQGQAAAFAESITVVTVETEYAKRAD